MTPWRRWWTHSVWSSLLFPLSRTLWRARLHLEHDRHADELAQVRAEREVIAAQVHDWLDTQGVLGAARKAKEARHV